MRVFIAAAVAICVTAPAHATVRHAAIPLPAARPLFDVVYCIGTSKLPLGCTPRPTSNSTAASSTTSATSSDPLAKIINDLTNVSSNVIQGAITDIQAADVDAGTIVTPAIPATPAVAAVPATATSPAVAAVPAFAGSPAQVRDPISHACYPALVQFLQTLPSYQPPTGKYVAVQQFQKARDFVAQIKSGLPTYLKLGCEPLLGDEVNTVVQGLALVGVKILPTALTAIMPATAPITLPALTLTP